MDKIASIALWINQSSISSQEHAWPAKKIRKLIRIQENARGNLILLILRMFRIGLKMAPQCQYIKKASCLVPKINHIIMEKHVKFANFQSIGTLKRMHVLNALHNKYLM
jgi:hypothetical protein